MFISVQRTKEPAQVRPREILHRIPDDRSDVHRRRLIIRIAEGTHLDAPMVATPRIVGMAARQRQTRRPVSSL